MKITLEAPNKEYVEDALHLAKRTALRAARNNNNSQIQKIYEALASDYDKVIQSITTLK